MRPARLFVRSGLVLLALVMSFARAQPFPNKPLHLIVPWPAGGAGDYYARLLANEMSAPLGQPITVENTPGAGGTLGVGKALKAPADGYTLLASSPIDTILSPLVFAGAGYKSEDVRPIVIYARTDVMLVTRKTLPVSTPNEFIALLKSRAERPLAYCSPGLGSLFHLVGERLNAAAGVKSLHVPYSGMPQCLKDMAGGDIDFAFLPISAPFTGFVDDGSIKAIAILGDAPHHRFPGVPLLSSSAGLESMSCSIWAGLHVHAKVPDDAAEALNRRAAAALASPELRRAVEQSGATLLAPQTLQQAQAEYAREIKSYTSFARALPRQ